MVKMKFILWTMLILLALQINHANAKSPKVEMIPFQMATAKTKALGFHTFAGEIIQMRQIKDMNSSKARALKSIIKDGLIELRSGDIFYSEELQYVVAPMGEFTGASNVLRLMHNPIARAPHTPK
jgi:hypothetical protein